MARVRKTQVFAKSSAIGSRSPAAAILEKDVPAAHAKFWAMVAEEMKAANWFRIQ